METKQNIGRGHDATKGVHSFSFYFLPSFATLSFVFPLSFVLFLASVEFNYGPAIDIWSAGIIMAEMLLQRLLIEGHDARGQLFATFAVLGPPPAVRLCGCWVCWVCLFVCLFVCWLGG